MSAVPFTRRARGPLALLSTLAVAWALIAGPAVAASGDVGTPASGFDLRIFGGGGATQSLADYNGQVVLLFIVGYS